MYAGIILINPALKAFTGLQSSCFQLLIAAAVLLPYTLTQVPLSAFLFTLQPENLMLLILIGVVHTGIAYLLYFSAIPKLSETDAAMSSYIDPISAVLFAMLFLHEQLNWMQACGAVVILGASWLLNKK